MTLKVNSFSCEVVVVLMARVCVLDEVWGRERRGEVQGEQKGGGGRSGNRKRAFLCLESVLTKNSKRIELSTTKIAC